MDLQRLMYGLLYRVGFAPWDGHPLAPRLVELADASKGRAIDLGCGTGDSSIHLAQRGWDVVAIDFVQRALDKARAKADAAGARVRWQRADVTRLRESGVGDGFQLLVDNGLLHGLSDTAREAYVREVSAIAAANATLLLVAFPPGNRGPGPRGIDRAEIERRFSAGWRLVGDGELDWQDTRNREKLRWYELRRAAS
jgi:SAM-dependent methyltransferase